MKIIQNKETCIGCGLCAEYCPKLWKISYDDGKVELIGSKKKGDVYVLEVDGKIAKENEPCARDCPVNAIKIEK